MSAIFSSRCPFGLMPLVALLLLAPAWAGEPSVRELIALAPVLNSSDPGCRSIDVSGYFGDDKGPGPRLQLRALYRAPDQFCLLISDAVDGTPLAYCSGKKIFIYDPVDTVVYYSENGGSSLEMFCAGDEVKFKYDFLFKTNKKSKILMDLRSVVSGEGCALEEGGFKDSLVKDRNQEYRLRRELEGELNIVFHIDMKKGCPYKAVTFTSGASTVFRFDRIALNVALDDDLFAFPRRSRLAWKLPLRDVTAVDDPAQIRRLSELVSRANIVRSVAYQAGSPEVLKIPGLAGVDWNHVKENDRRYSKTLKDFVPSGLQSR